MKLRPYQVEALTASKARYWAGVNRQIINLPTGLGKTPILASVPDFFGFQKRTLVIAHREELIDQAVDKIKTWASGRTVGVEMAGRTAGNADIVVASIQTIGRKGSSRLTKLDPADFDCILVDEAHHSLGQSYQTVFEHFKVLTNPKILLVGFTATVNRGDGQGLGKIFQAIVYRKSIIEAIKEGWIVDIKGIRVKTGVDLSDVHSTGGDFNLAELAHKVNTPAGNDLTVRSWLQHGQNRQTVAFTVDVRHAKDLADAFKKYGVAAEAIWGDDPRRKEKLQYHKAGKLKVLANCQLLSEGYDDEEIGCIVLDRNTQSEPLFVQLIGRGARINSALGNLVDAKKAGKVIAKQDMILIDMVAATSKHSLATLPSLFGLNPQLDMHGKSLVQVANEVEAIKKAHPMVDLSNVQDIGQLRSYAESVDLFRQNWAPEVIQHSAYQWRKSGTDCYVLLLQGGDYVALKRTLLNWRILGTVSDKQVDDARDTFEEAIKEADYKVFLLGGRNLLTLVKRNAPWHKLVPSPAQLKLAASMRLTVPAGITRGELQMKTNEIFLKRKIERMRVA